MEWCKENGTIRIYENVILLIRLNNHTYAALIICEHILHITIIFYTKYNLILIFLLGQRLCFSIEVNVIGLGGEKIVCASWD
jgi:hypothetical protein